MMHKATESRRGLPPAFWLAQGFVGLALIVLAFRHRGDDVGTSLPRVHARESLPASPLSSIGPAPEPAPRPKRSELRGAPYIPEEYQSRVRIVDDYVEWTLDSRELAWLRANRRQVLGVDLETEPESEGGLRVKVIRQGSFGERRGLRIGDVLLDINGRDLDSREDLEDFLEDPAHSGAGGWRVRVKRGPEILILDYRSAS